MNTPEPIAGLAFPFAIDPQTGGFAWARDREKIRQNIRILLSTRIGERPMQRNFGTRLPSLVHDMNSAVLAQIAITQTQEALLQWEPRVLVTDATVEQQEGELKLNLRYAFLAEQTNDELALPLL
jgi:phage baseplate assembly protein W